MTPFASLPHHGADDTHPALATLLQALGPCLKERTASERRDGREVQRTTQPSQSETEFEIFTGEVDDQLVFVKDAKGQVTYLLADGDTQVKKLK